MNATEVRLGNWINKKYKDYGTDQFYWSNAQVISNDIEGITVYPDNYKAIPLTEEWLVKMGFDGNPNNGYVKNFIELGYIVQDEYFEFEYFRQGISSLIVQVKYVHQLQNLYFALTGQELTIKP